MYIEGLLCSSYMVSSVAVTQSSVTYLGSFTAIRDAAVIFSGASAAFNYLFEVTSPSVTLIAAIPIIRRPNL